MKTAIHPQYFAATEIKCSCGNVIITGSTREKLRTELCSNCHPFYTGQQKLVDTAGRVDKFEALRSRAKKMQEETKLKAAARKKKPDAYQEKEVSPEVIARAMENAQPEGKWSAPLGDSLAEEVVKEQAAEALEAEAEPKKKASAAKKKAPRKAK